VSSIEGKGSERKMKEPSGHLLDHKATWRGEEGRESKNSGENL